MSAQVDYTIFGRTAAENYHRDFVPLIPAPLAADLIEAAAPDSGEFVLDIACGTGVLTRLAAQRVGTAGRVVGVDLNPEMLRIAGAIPGPSGVTIEWREANAEALPLPDESYDLVLCQLGLMFVADRPLAVQEMWRVLSPGGRVAINAPDTIPRLFEIMSEALGRHINPEAAGFVRSVFSLPANELDGLLRGADFRDVTVKTAPKTLRLPPPADFLWQYVGITPASAIVAAADDDSRKKFEADVVGEWSEFVDDDGLVLELPLLTATARK